MHAARICCLALLPSCCFHSWADFDRQELAVGDIIHHGVQFLCQLFVEAFALYWEGLLCLFSCIWQNDLKTRKVGSR